MKTTSKKRKIKGNLLSADWAMKNVSYLVLLAVLGLCYIFNTNRAERKLVQIHESKVELRELRYQYSTLRKDLKSETVLSKLEDDLQGKVQFPTRGPIIIGPDKS